MDFRQSSLLVPRAFRSIHLIGKANAWELFQKKMNARSQVFELSVEGRQIEEAILSIFHSILLHRTSGKFSYKREGSYTIGTVGMVDVDCDFINSTYVRVDSDELHRSLRRQVAEFRESLKSPEGLRSGQISIEFYQKKKTRWPFGMENIPWEIWTVKLNVVTLANEHERQICREKVGEALAEKIICIAGVMNRPEYVPKMPNQSDVANVFDVSFKEVQPYLHKFSYQASDQPSQSVGTTMRRLLLDTFSY